MAYGLIGAAVVGLSLAWVTVESEPIIEISEPVITIEEPKKPLDVPRETPKAKTSSSYDPAVMAAVAAEFGEDAPVMLRVADCESKYRQFYDDGSVFRGVINSRDVGAMQINETYHLAASKAMGLNIHTLEGNVAYARYLYNTQGTVPWSWSKGCWGG